MNKIKPVPHPEVPKDYPSAMLQTRLNAEILVTCLGISWMRSNRLSMIKYVSLISMIKLAIFKYKKRHVLIEKLTLLSK